MTKGPLVVLTTDFGLVDHYVGVMRGVLLGICPDARVIDLSHEVSPQDVVGGAYLLLCAYRYFPPGTIHLAIVDPGVGTERRALALRADDYYYVGPDNGLFSYVLQDMAQRDRIGGRLEGDRFVLGDRCQAVHLTRDDLWLKPTSDTFHGRDIFAPVAGHLGCGTRLEDLGTPVDRLVAIPWPWPRRDGMGRVTGEVVHVDRFGNLATSLRDEDLPSRNVELLVAGRKVRGLYRTYGEARGGGPVALLGSCGLVEIAVPNGSAARELGVGRGEPVVAMPAIG